MEIIVPVRYDAEPHGCSEHGHDRAPEKEWTYTMEDGDLKTLVSILPLVKSISKSIHTYFIGK